MAGKEHGVIRDASKTVVDGVIHGERIGSRKIGAPTTFEKEGVTGHQSAIDEEALTSRRVARSVDQLHSDGSDSHHVATVMADQMRRAHAGGPLHPRHLLLLEMDWNLDPLQQRADALETPPRHLPTDMIRVIVRG